MMILTFLAVMVVTAVLFGGWVIMTIIRLIGRLFAGSPHGGVFGSSSRCCANPGCRTINPAHANFCRRCGANLTNPMGHPHPGVQRPPAFNPSNGNGRRVASL
jgi:hypothetical protein